MNQKVWGPHMWFSLHSITFTYPFKPSNEDKELVINFFTSLKNILPCITCQLNYTKNLQDLPIQTGSRKELVYWLIDLHNKVNIETGKSVMDYKSAIKYYEKQYGCRIYLDQEEQEKDESNNCMLDRYHYNWIYIFVIIIILLISFLKFKNSTFQH